MRIAIVNWSNRRFGGTGTYLSTLMPALAGSGHDVALLHEVEEPGDQPPLPMPTQSPAWSVSALGVERAMQSLREWRPDVLYAHGLLDPDVERRVLDVAPAVFFAHNYYGTCITGAKTVRRPVVTPCNRRFGWQCLAQYYPRGCGGLSPVSMVRQYQQQRERLQLLSKYSAIVTHSTHMQQEYINHGLNAGRVFNVRCGADDVSPSTRTSGTVAKAHEGPWELLFAGRMDDLKGGCELIQSLPHVVRRLSRGVRLTFAGDGPMRAQWERLAQRMCRVESRVDVRFAGWLPRKNIDTLFSQSDLLVLPSLWPEPFALVGLEAARHQLPVAAFAVGGISDWLTPGQNGFLAPGDPPTVDGLVDAIVACLKDPVTHARLREGAGALSADFAFEKHIELLLRAFDKARLSALAGTT